MTRKHLAITLIPLLLDCIRAQRKNPAARAEVREAIIRVRQLRGVVEYETRLENVERDLLRACDANGVTLQDVGDELARQFGKDV